MTMAIGVAVKHLPRKDRSKNYRFDGYEIHPAMHLLPPGLVRRGESNDLDENAYSSQKTYFFYVRTGQSTPEYLEGVKEAYKQFPRVDEVEVQLLDTEHGEWSRLRVTTIRYKVDLYEF